MRVHFVGGPENGDIIETGTTEVPGIPPGYEPGTWSGGKEAITWQHRRHVVYIHVSLDRREVPRLLTAHWRRFVGGELRCLERA
ncbi:hypothetical protein HH299_15660 [Xanthomonas sp. Kuri4-2]